MQQFQTTEKINKINLNRMLNSRAYTGENADDTFIQLEKLRKQLGRSGSQAMEFEMRSYGGMKAGRLYPKKNRAGRAPQSLQDLPKIVRKALANDHYYDVDIKNAHPTILNQLLQKNGIQCPSLTAYVNDRDAYLDIAPKEAWNKYIYNGAPIDSPPGSPEWDFFTDVYASMKMLLSLSQYDKYNLLAKKRKSDNAHGCAVAFLAQDLEREIVSRAIRSFQRSGFTVGTIIHDGFLVEKNEGKSLEDAFKSAEEAVKEELGYDIELVQKPLDDYDPSLLWTEDASINDDEMGDAECAKAFLDWCHSQGLYLKRCGDACLFYRQDEGVWVNSKNFNTLKPYMTKAGDTGHLPWKYGQMTKNKDALLKEMTQLIEDEPDFFQKANASTKCRIAFNDGIYNFETKQLEPFEQKYRFFYKLPWDYGVIDQSLADEIYKRVLDPIFTCEDPSHPDYEEQRKARDYCMKVLARASAGEINDKTFHLFVGLGNSGKGVLTELLKMAFISGGFVGTFSGDSLTSGERSDSDIEKSNSWIIGLMNKRFAIGNEIDRSKKLSANKIKMFASGGDTIEVVPVEGSK